MDNPAITYDELKAALEEDSCARVTEPALFALLDKLDQAPSLFGRWATHKDHGRGIIISDKPDGDGEVRFAYRNSSYADDVDTRFVRREYLDLDPVALNTTQDFKDAPDGTIVEIMAGPKDVYVKEGLVWFGAGGGYATSATALAKARVIRWGNGK